MTDWDEAAERLEDYMAKRPVGGPYLLKEGEYPFTIAIFRVSDGALVWAVTVLAPERGLLRMLEIPPAATWIGEPVDAVTIKPEKWPEGWRRTL